MVVQWYEDQDPRDIEEEGKRERGTRERWGQEGFYFLGTDKNHSDHEVSTAICLSGGLVAGQHSDKEHEADAQLSSQIKWVGDCNNKKRV